MEEETSEREDQQKNMNKIRRKREKGTDKGHVTNHQNK